MSEERQKRTYTRRLHNSPENATLRLEIVRLCHRHDQSASVIIARAKELEAYIIGGQPADKA